jgi:hypothetical protein
MSSPRYDRRRRHRTQPRDNAKAESEHERKRGHSLTNKATTSILSMILRPSLFSSFCYSIEECK